MKGVKLKHKNLREACWRYTKENGPCTLQNMMDGATYTSGRPVRHSRLGPKSIQQMGSLFSRDPRFIKAGRIDCGTGFVCLWVVE